MSNFPEKRAALQMLTLVTRRVSEGLPSFSGWLTAGFGAAFALVIANIETVSKFIYITHIRFGLLIFLLSVILTVLANYLSAIVKVALAAQDDGDAIGKSIAAQTTELDLSRILDEYRRGLLPPVRWIAESSINKALQGDIVAGARLIAKLSQVQALLVLAQGLLAIVAVAALAFGLKLE